jgi:hypothetical protein
MTAHFHLTLFTKCKLQFLQHLNAASQNNGFPFGQATQWEKKSSAIPSKGHSSPVGRGILLYKLCNLPKYHTLFHFNGHTNFFLIAFTGVRAHTHTHTHTHTQKLPTDVCSSVVYLYKKLNHCMLAKQHVTELPSVAMNVSTLLVHMHQTCIYTEEYVTTGLIVNVPLYVAQTLCTVLKTFCKAHTHHKKEI